MKLVQLYYFLNDLPDGFNTCEDIRFPQIWPVWKIRKNKPKKLVMVLSSSIFFALLYFIPDDVTYEHFADHRGAPQKPEIYKNQISTKGICYTEIKK